MPGGGVGFSWFELEFEAAWAGDGVSPTGIASEEAFGTPTVTPLGLPAPIPVPAPIPRRSVPGRRPLERRVLRTRSACQAQSTGSVVARRRAPAAHGLRSRSRVRATVVGHGSVAIATRSSVTTRRAGAAHAVGSSRTVLTRRREPPPPETLIALDLL